MPIVFRADVVRNDIPMLISRRALVATQAQLDFKTNILSRPAGEKVQATLTEGGHLALSLIPAKVAISRTSSSSIVFFSEDTCFSSDISGSSNNELTIADVLRILWRMGHATSSALKRLLLLGERQVSGRTILDAIRRCPCHRLGGKLQGPLMTKLFRIIPDVRLLLTFFTP